MHVCLDCKVFILLFRYIVVDGCDQASELTHEAMLEVCQATGFKRIWDS